MTNDLLPMSTPLDTLTVLRAQARSRLDVLLPSADRKTLLMLVPLLARLGESPLRNR